MPDIRSYWSGSSRQRHTNRSVHMEHCTQGVHASALQHSAHATRATTHSHLAAKDVVHDAASIVIVLEARQQGAYAGGGVGGMQGLNLWGARRMEGVRGHGGARNAACDDGVGGLGLWSGVHFWAKGQGLGGLWSAARTGVQHALGWEA